MATLSFDVLASSDEEAIGIETKQSSVSGSVIPRGPTDSPATEQQAQAVKRRRTQTISGDDLAVAAKGSSHEKFGKSVIARAVARPLLSAPSKDIGSDAGSKDNSKATENSGNGGDHEGYTLRDLRRVVETVLPRYGMLLSADERAAIVAFERLPLRARQLYARILGRKWPQWLRFEGLGARYRELGESETIAAIAELAAPPPSEPMDLTYLTQPPCQAASSGTWARLLEEHCGAADNRSDGANLDIGHSAKVAASRAAATPWLLDSATESVATLLARPLPQPGDPGRRSSFGTLLVEALPAGELRQLARGLGMSIPPSGGRRGAKRRLLGRLCDVARQQRVINGSGGTLGTAEARLVSQALLSGRWVCATPGPGHTAFSVLTELFHMETSGVAESSYVVFSSRWPLQVKPPPSFAPPLFDERAPLDSYLAARRLLARFESMQERPTEEYLATEAAVAEREFRKALAAAAASPSETSKLRHRYRRRFTAAWCWADALHHAVMHAPAVGDDSAARKLKIERLKLLLSTRFCVSRRGRWYSELAKELVRAESPRVALHVAAEGLAEGEPPPVAARVTFDLTEDLSSQECTMPSTAATPNGHKSPSVARADDELPLPVLPQDLRWDLARRCRALAARAAAASAPPGRAAAAARAWQKQLRDSPAAQAKAAGGDDGGRWLPALVLRLIAEEDKAPGPVHTISATSLALPQIPSDGRAGRRLYDSFDLQELNVEELALTHYLGTGDFCCGIHCEGALLRDLFGLLLYDELFDTSVSGVFTSTFQDAPLDLGTEDFYAARAGILEKRFAEIGEFTPRDLAREVRARLATLWGTRIRGVRWDRYVGPSGAFRQEGAEPTTGSNEVAKGPTDKTQAVKREDAETEVVTSDDEAPRRQEKESEPVSENSNDESCPDPGAAGEAGKTSPAESSRRVLWTSGTQDAPIESQDLGAAAGAIGGRALVAGLRLLCQDYNSAGLPDLLLWRWMDDGSTVLRARARFVEVKSERDKLARRQKLWLATLRSGGAEAEVCHVRDSIPSSSKEEA